MSNRTGFVRGLEVTLVGLLLIGLFAGFAMATPASPDTPEEKFVCVNEKSGEVLHLPADAAEKVDRDTGHNKNVDCSLLPPTPVPTP